MKPHIKNPSPVLRLFLLAGLAGGLAEVLWVSLYSLAAPASAAEIARQITATIAPAASLAPLAPAFGVIIHFVLSLLLATAFGLAIWAPFASRLGTVGALASAVSALAAVWAVNFFLVLPALNPAFVSLMPLSVTLVSKALFGTAMGLVLGGAQRQKPAAHRWAGIGGSSASMR